MARRSISQRPPWLTPDRRPRPPGRTSPGVSTGSRPISRAGPRTPVITTSWPAFTSTSPDRWRNWCGGWGQESRRVEPCCWSGTARSTRTRGPRRPRPVRSRSRSTGRRRARPPSVGRLDLAGDRPLGRSSGHRRRRGDPCATPAPTPQRARGRFASRGTRRSALTTRGRCGGVEASALVGACVASAHAELSAAPSPAQTSPCSRARRSRPRLGEREAGPRCELPALPRSPPEAGAAGITKRRSAPPRTRGVRAAQLRPGVPVFAYAATPSPRSLHRAREPNESPAGGDVPISRRLRRRARCRSDAFAHR